MDEIRTIKTAAWALIRIVEKRWNYIKSAHENVDTNDNTHFLYKNAIPYANIELFKNKIEQSEDLEELKTVFEQINILNGYCEAHTLVNRLLANSKISNTRLL